jgi:hypothetical protein
MHINKSLLTIILCIGLLIELLALITEEDSGATLINGLIIKQLPEVNSLELLDNLRKSYAKSKHKAAAHGLEGLPNLENTMLDNGLQLPGSSCSSKQGSLWRWVGSDVEGLVSAGVCRENRHTLNFCFYRHSSFKQVVRITHKN